MAAKWIEALTGSLEQKKQYRQYKARIDALAQPYGSAAKAVERYLMLAGGIVDGDTMVTMLGDLADLWERAAADGTPVRDIVGDDPAEFAETFARAYNGKVWLDKERARLDQARSTRPQETRSEHDHLTAPAIRVQGVTKAYKDLQVLRGVDFEVERGSIFALLGSNGAGKTTLVRILSTLLKADGGSATVHGFDVATAPDDVREAISLTGQFAAVDEILSGRENLVLVAKLRHLEDPGAIADGLLARFSLTDAGGRRAGTYSGGMRRRLDIAMSLIGDPPVIFLDEPTTGLDPQARIEVWDTVKELANGGTTVLLTTQYLDEAEQLADRIAILHEGVIIQNGTLAELKRLLPQATVEYVEKQPTLEEVFLALVGPSQAQVPSTGSGAENTSSVTGKKEASK